MSISFLNVTKAACQMQGQSCTLIMTSIRNNHSPGVRTTRQRDKFDLLGQDTGIEIHNYNDFLV